MILILLSVVTLTAQQPPRDARSIDTPGAATVHGVVVDAPTGTPIPEARVVLSGRGDGPLSLPRSHHEALTDDAGYFEFTNVPAGPYVLLAHPGELRGGHLPAVLGYEEFTPLARGPSFTLSAGEKKNVRVPLRRGHAVEGRVIDEYGEPMADVTVEARRSDNGGWDERSVATDDRGLFRLFGLHAAAYEVCAEPMASRRWRPAGPEQGDAARASYARTCLPEPVDSRAADTPLVVIQAQRTGTFTLTGTLISETGVDLRLADVSVNRKRAQGGWSGASARTVNGRFTAEGLLPGDYVVSARLRAGRQYGAKILEAGTARVRIDSSDIADLTITTRPPGGVAGRVVKDPRARGPLPLGFSVLLLPPLGSADDTGPTESVVVREGRFELDEILEPRVVAVAGLPSGWFVEAVRRGGEDITGVPQDFRPPGGEPIEIVLSDRSATLYARAVDPAGALVADAAVLLLPLDAGRWTAQLFRASALAKRTGDYVELGGQRPGEYAVLAVRSGGLLRLMRDPAAVTALVRDAPRVTLVAGKPVRMDVRIVEEGRTR